MIMCSFEEETTLPDGSYRHSKCVQKAEILILNDPCYGLCYQCAYDKVKAENAKLRKALETDKVIFQLIEEDHCRPRKMRSNTSGKCRDALERIEKALKQ